MPASGVDAAGADGEAASVFFRLRVIVTAAPTTPAVAMPPTSP